MASFNLGENELKQSAEDDLGIRTYTHFYKVATDQFDTGYVAGAALGIPRIGETHRQDFSAYCTKVTPKVLDGPLKKGPTSTLKGILWEVACQFSTFNLVQNINPLVEPAKVVWVGEGYQRMTQTDKDGNVVTNAAYVPVPPMSKDETRPIAKIKKNVFGLPVAAITTWPDSINKSPFNFRGISIPEKVAKYKFEQLSDTKVRNGQQYYEFTFSLHFRESWAKRVPNKGRYQRLRDAESGDYKLYPVLDANNVKTTQDVPLNNDGSQKVIPTKTIQPEDIPYFDVDLHNELNFSVLRQYFN